VTRSATVLDMSISLDGFIAGPNERTDNGLGDGGERLHAWFFQADGEAVDPEAFRGRGGVNGQVIDELMSTGAVVAGRGTFEPAGDHALRNGCHGLPPLLDPERLKQLGLDRRSYTRAKTRKGTGSARLNSPVARA
jgi:hypothetical protein